MKKTLKETIREAAEHYKKHADWEKNRADRVTQGSTNQQEILRACAYNRGRAAAMREALEYITKFLG